MKKINYYLFVTIAAVGLVACSSEEVASVQDFQRGLKTSESIAFSPLSKNATRSTVINSTSDMTSFKVRGTWNATQAAGDIYINGQKVTLTAAINAGTEYIGQVQETATSGTYELATAKGFGSGIEIVNNSGAWNYKNSSETQYWPFKAEGSNPDQPTGYTCLPLNFNAVTPASADIDLETKQFVYTNTTAPDVADMVDICYADTTNMTNANAPVLLTFKHLFCQVIVKAKKASDYTVDIKSVQINGMKYNGTASMTSKPLTWSATGNATNYNAYGSATASTAFAVPASAASEAPVKMTPTGQELLLIPQTIAKWVPETDGAIAENVSKAKGWIAITYRAKKSDAASWATGNAQSEGYTTTYFPLQATWKAGKIYAYTLLFGGVADPEETGTDPENPDPGAENPGGFDDLGKPAAPSVAITFTAKVDDWASENVDISF
jgi:hypothetical protein